MGNSNGEGYSQLTEEFIHIVAFAEMSRYIRPR